MATSVSGLFAGRGPRHCVKEEYEEARARVARGHGDVIELGLVVGPGQYVADLADSIGEFGRPITYIP
jgi:hypothetical protein